MLRRLAQIAAYNRDWHQYVVSKFKPPRQGQLLHFRLRNGQRLALKSENRFLLNEIYLDRVYDIEGMDFENCSTVLDIGGNVGLFALYVTSRSSNARIYSFEPASENLDLMRENLAANPRQAERISVFPMAVGAANGTATLHLSGTPAEYSTVGDESDAGRVETVKCVDLATVFELTGVDEFDFVKVDIEGAEKYLLQGAKPADLRRFKVLVMEWHYSREELEAMAKRFKSIGFDARPVILEGHMRFLHARRLRRA